MAKVSPVSIKYMIHARLHAEGALERPDVIGAIFGQTEGLLGSELEMRELQKEGKIGRIEVDIERQGKQSEGVIKVPTALDQSETTLIAAAMETIERVGPCDATIEIDRIEDVRGSKRDYIIDRAKALMKDLHSGTDSREISNEIKTSTKTAAVQEYGPEKLPCGDISGEELIVVEGRADVLSLLRAGVTNCIAMNGTKLPDTIKELSSEKQITLFLDGDRGGKLIARNAVDNVLVAYIAVAPDGKEVEELMPKEVLMNLRRKMTPDEFFDRMERDENGNGRSRGPHRYNRDDRSRNVRREEPSSPAEPVEPIEVTDDVKKTIREMSGKYTGTDKAALLDRDLRVIKEISARTFSGSLRRIQETPTAIIFDGTVTKGVLSAAEEKGVQIVAARNFSTVESPLTLLSL